MLEALMAAAVSERSFRQGAVEAGAMVAIEVD